MLQDGCCVTIRWRPGTPPATAYDLWMGDGWSPVTEQEIKEYRARGYSIHTNPRWATR